MRVLVCHNYYQIAGGEDQVFADEAALLESRGHEVLRYTRHNDEIEGRSRLAVARETLFSKRAYRELLELIRRERPDVMHCTNLFPLISPAAYYAARQEGVPVVQSLHNFRLWCANGLFLRGGRTCEDCLGKLLPWPAVWHACYRGSRAATAAVAAMQVYHRLRRTSLRMVDRYIALSQFARAKFIEGGLPAERISIKPNFLAADPGVGGGAGGYAAFVGRLSAEKGVETLLAAWRRLAGRVPLRILGDGPLRPLVEQAAAADPSIQWLGFRKPEEVGLWLADAACVLMPSICYENLPKVLIEAYARGTPLIASRIGSLVEAVVDGETGRLFPAGDADVLATTVDDFFNRPAAQSALRAAARARFEQLYTADANYEQLMEVYRRAGCAAAKSEVATPQVPCGMGFSPSEATHAG